MLELPNKTNEEHHNNVDIIEDNNEEINSSIFTLKNFRNFVLFCNAIFLVWIFLVMLSLMGNGFKLLGMKDSSKMFDIVDNPISALMIGILVTVLVQSSSTSTSIIIGLVGADELSVKNAIPMIMGANIGTSVTNTIVSLGSYNNKENYKRAFAGATIHDIFNFLTVLVLLPIQWASNFLGEITWKLSKDQQPCEGDCEKWEGPIKKIVKPVVSKIIQIDKKVSKYIYQGYCNGYCDYDCSDEERDLLTNIFCNDDSCDIVEYKNNWKSDDMLKCKRFPQYFSCRFI